MRVLVVGGTGCVGSRLVSALTGHEGFDVTATSRDGRDSTSRLDLRHPDTWPDLTSFDGVVNVTDGFTAPPDDLVLRCLESGLLFLETSADSVLLERLRRRASEVDSPRGALVLGVGLFPGLSNLLARDVVGSEPCQRLELGVRYTPLSLAGRGVCRLMAESITRPALRFEAGQRVMRPAVQPGPELPFADGWCPTLEVGLACSLLFHESLGVPTTASHLSPVPFPAVTPTRWAVRLTPWGLLRFPGVKPALNLGISLVRRVLFAGRGSRIELTAIADRARKSFRYRTLVVEDGMLATAQATAAVLPAFSRCRPEPGVHFLDQLLTLEDALAGFRELGFPEPTIHG